MNRAKPRPKLRAAWFENWQVAAASVTGTSHLERSLESQDSFQTNFTALKDPISREVNRNRPLIISVADGLGSGRHAAAGATLATSLSQITTEEEFSDQQWNKQNRAKVNISLRQAVSRAGDAWLSSLGSREREVQRRGIRQRRIPGHERGGAVLEAKEFRTTLLLAVLRPPWLAVAQVGDGLVVIRRGSGECVLLDRSRSAGEYANTTAYLCETDSVVDITVRFVPSITGIAVATDGLEDCVLRPGIGTTLCPKKEFFGPVFAEVASGERDSERTLRLLRSPALRAETDDDLTLVVAAKQCMDSDGHGQDFA